MVFKNPPLSHESHLNRYFFARCDARNTIYGVPAATVAVSTVIFFTECITCPLLFFILLSIVYCTRTLETRKCTYAMLANRTESWPDMYGGLAIF